MHPSADHFEKLLDRFVAWASDQNEIRSIVLIGSRARQDHPADEASDMDLIIFTPDPQHYLSSIDWIRQIDSFCLTFLEPTANGRFMERRVLFEGGYDIDFVFLPEQAIRQELQTGLSPEITLALSRGTRVLLDRDGLAEELLAALPKLPANQPPSSDEFLNLVHDFWYHAVWTAKKLSRGELWTAKSCCDSYMKWRLLRMIEWSTQANHDWQVDTWHDGRFLERWADPQVLTALHSAYASYDLEDVWRALDVTMDLFHDLAVETARVLGVPYPSEGESCAREVVAEVRQM